MSTRMSSGPSIARDGGDIRNKRFLNLWVWARESQFPVTALSGGERTREMSSACALGSMPLTH